MAKVTLQVEIEAQEVRVPDWFYAYQGDTLLVVEGAVYAIQDSKGRIKVLGKGEHNAPPPAPPAAPIMRAPPVIETASALATEVDALLGEGDAPVPTRPNDKPARKAARKPARTVGVVRACGSNRRVMTDRQQRELLFEIVNFILGEPGVQSTTYRVSNALGLHITDNLGRSTIRTLMEHGVKRGYLRRVVSDNRRRIYGLGDADMNEIDPSQPDDRYVPAR